MFLYLLDGSKIEGYSLFKRVYVVKKEEFFGEDINRIDWVEYSL